ncbi:MAG: hypothetical protein Q4D05_08110 [Acinetobacter sp.]|nr:hypothetical protein [Acinetobacter sp.]
MFKLMVAGYQKYLESDTLGLTNAAEQVKTLIQEHGTTGLQMDGHSRGTLTITNAYSSLLNDGDAGAYPNLRTNMVGAAANIKRADAKLATLQGRNEILTHDPANPNISTYRSTTEGEKEDMSIHYQGHAADPIHGMIGFNSSTGGTTKPNNVLGIIKEAGRSILGKETTAHNCYGVGSEACKQQGLLENKQPMKWEPVYKLKIEKKFKNNNQNKQEGK